MSASNTLPNKPVLTVKPATRYEYWGAIVALLFAFWLFHPDLVMLQASPMLGDLWSNKDPSVSWSAYMPGLREFRYELFENGNILWSPHRGLGQPILGNGVQGAPLFPLTLAQLWLPDQYFWSINPMSRIFIAALMLFLCARNLFNMPWAAALVFTLLAAYNINMFRWINHPWTNGALAGVWYLYFLVQVSLPNNFSSARQVLHAVALVLGVIGMVTNGFPEASAVFAFVVFFIYPTIIIARWSEFKTSAFMVVGRLALLHIAGFGLCAVQIMGLLDYIDYTEVLGLRDGISNNAFQDQDIAPYLNSQLSIFWKTDAQRDYISFTVGVIGGFLALQGLLSWILDAKRFGRIPTLVGLGFILSMAMFVIKSFGLSNLVEWVFSKTPVLDVSHFPLYFPPMFYFGSAFFAALGLMAYWQPPSKSRCYHITKLIWALSSFGLLIAAIRVVAIHFSAIGLKAFWLKQFSGEGFLFLLVFLTIAIAIIGFHAAHALRLNWFIRRSSGAMAATLVGTLTVIGVGLEQQHTVKANFISIDNNRLFRTAEEWAGIDQAVKASGLPKHELRTRDESGFYIQTGLATIDNGASAMLPADLRLVRRVLFDAPYGGYVPLKGQRYDWSSWLLSNNLTFVHSTPFSDIDWSAYTRTDSMQPRNVGIEPQLTIKRENPVFLSAWVTSFSEPHATTIWAKLDDGKQGRWIQTNNGGQRSSTVEQRTQTSSSWRIRQPIHELPSDEYQLTLRAVNDIDKTFQDTPPITLKLEQPKVTIGGSELIKVPTDSVLAQYDNGTRSIYFEHNALPRAFVASSCVAHSDENDSLELLKQGLPVLAGKVAINSSGAGFCSNYNKPFKHVPIVSDQGSRLSFESIKGPALLFVNDSFYPGWQARESESAQMLEVKRANVAMRAVYLPEAKDYNIEMFYQPSWLKWVQLVTLIAFLLLAWGLYTIFRTSSRKEQL